MDDLRERHSRCGGGGPFVHASNRVTSGCCLYQSVELADLTTSS